MALHNYITVLTKRGYRITLTDKLVTMEHRPTKTSSSYSLLDHTVEEVLRTYAEKL